MTNLFTLSSLSCLCLLFWLFSLHVAACSLHPACFCLEMGDEPEGVWFNPCATKPLYLLFLSAGPASQRVDDVKAVLPAELWAFIECPVSVP